MMHTRRQRSSELLRATAYHEAGHAVVAFRLSIPFEAKGVNIDASDGHHGIFYHSGSIGGDPTNGLPTGGMVAKAERQAMCSLAGLEAQRRYRPSSVRNYHAHHDYSAAVDLLSHFAADVEEVSLWLRLLRHRTKSIVESEAWWPVIEQFAEILLERRRLTGKEAMSILRKKSSNATNRPAHFITNYS